MAADPSTMNDPELVRRLMINAEARGARDLMAKCQRRLYELAGVAYDDELERRLWQAVAAYEETLRKKHGRAQKASYTRRKIATKGALATLSDWALDTKMTDGFRALVNNGMAEFTGEYVVLEFADRFDPSVVKAAQRRLADSGAKLPPTMEQWLGRQS
jgi:hypothetical protein